MSTRSGSISWSKLALVGCLAVSVALAGCALTDERSGADQQVRLIAHDSFVVTDAAVEQLKRDTGIDLVVITAGDAGSLVGNAVLNDGKIGADVLFGVDEILLPRALAAGVFVPHKVATTDLLPEFQTLTADGLVMPIDYGDVCVNVDQSWYKSNSIPLPTSLSDFAQGQYRGQLVVSDPAASSPGLAFLLATVAKYGEEGFIDYWLALKANDVLVVGDWTQAYVGNFTAGGGNGKRPAVVSYATSPPAEIIYAAPPPPESPKSFAISDGCYRQVEFAGVLSGAANESGAKRVIEWLVSQPVQETVAETMFVLPTRAGVALPEVFERFATKVDRPLQLDATLVKSKQAEWVASWSKVMNR